MPIEPMQYRGIRCPIDDCGREFRTLDEYKGHQTPDGEPCPGGTPR